jgi:hypothetical protein
MRWQVLHTLAVALTLAVTQCGGSCSVLWQLLNEWQLLHTLAVARSILAWAISVHLCLCSILASLTAVSQPGYDHFQIFPLVVLILTASVWTAFVRPRRRPINNYVDTAVTPMLILLAA